MNDLFGKELEIMGKKASRNTEHDKYNRKHGQQV